MEDGQSLNAVIEAWNDNGVNHWSAKVIMGFNTKVQRWWPELRGGWQVWLSLVEGQGFANWLAEWHSANQLAREFPRQCPTIVIHMWLPHNRQWALYGSSNRQFVFTPPFCYRDSLRQSIETDILALAHNEYHSPISGSKWILNLDQVVYKFRPVYKK